MVQVYNVESFPEYFDATISKMKTHELREDPTQQYKVGDLFLLQEYNPETATYTGRTATVAITYISPTPRAWIVPGYTLMSTKLVETNPWTDLSKG